MEVAGFASSDLSRGKANGVAVPDVDIVAALAGQAARCGGGIGGEMVVKTQENCGFTV